MNYIFWSCRDSEEAKRIARLLLEKNLIACASLLPQVESLYRWKGKVEEGKEVKVILKTQKKHFEAICDCILREGSYAVPEIVQIEAADAYAPYAAWLKTETSNDA